MEKGYRKSDDPQVQSNINKMEKFFGEYELDNLIRDGKIKPECITSRQNLSKYLKNLKSPPLNVIECFGDKRDKRYRLKDEFYYEGIRVRNKEVLDVFAPSEIKIFSGFFDGFFEDESCSGVIYGLRPDVYERFTKNQKKIIEEYLEDIESDFIRLDRKIRRSLKMLRKVEVDKLINNYLNETKSENIKRFLEEKKEEFWRIICEGLVDTIRDRKFFFSNEPQDKQALKSDFFSSLGWIFVVPGGDGILRTPGVYNMNDELDVFMSKYNFFRPRELSKEEISRYCKAWSKHFFKKDYDFSLEEIREILEWVWSNRENLICLWTPSLALSVYNERVPSDFPRINLDIR